METNTHHLDHDFAPAWLKLPTIKNTESSKNQLIDQQSQRKTQPPLNRKDQFNVNPTSTSATNEWLNCNNHNNKSFHYLTSRHNSFGDDDQYHNGYSNESSVNKFKSNESTRLFRGDDNFHSKITTTSLKGNLNVKEKDSKGKSVEQEKPQQNNSFNQEFPSLINNDLKGVNDNSHFTQSQSAWSNNSGKNRVLSTLKNVQLIQRSVTEFDNNQDGNLNNSNDLNNSSTLISQSIASKASTTNSKRNLSLIGFTRKDSSLINGNGIGHCAKILPVLGKTNFNSSQLYNNSTQNMEILVKNPKMRGNKSDFLKSLKKEDAKDKLSLSSSEKTNNRDINIENGYNDKQNIGSTNNCLTSISDPVSIKEIQIQDDKDDDSGYNIGDDIGDGILSSSLEAEHRFLLELGWKKEDEVPPITEEEVKEFKDLMTARNGFKRNFNINQSLQLNLIPKKTTTINSLSVVADSLTNHLNENDDDSSSSSDEDD